MRYGGNSARSNRPECYGRSQYFSAGDADCQRCEFFDDCEETVSSPRIRPRSVRINNPRPVHKGDGAATTSNESGVIREDETAGQRFVKDCATGACRGAAWEAYQFFCNFRF